MSDSLLLLLLHPCTIWLHQFMSSARRYWRCQIDNFSCILSSCRLELIRLATLECIRGLHRVVGHATAILLQDVLFRDLASFLCSSLCSVETRVLVGFTLDGVLGASLANFEQVFLMLLGDV